MFLPEQDYEADLRVEAVVAHDKRVVAVGVRADEFHRVDVRGLRPRIRRARRSAALPMWHTNFTMALTSRLCIDRCKSIVNGAIALEEAGVCRSGGRIGGDSAVDMEATGDCVFDI